ncbi:MAG: hypothetical protein HQK99_07335 [Nitrospirae bacterium]|nr:hypothetical protein [Nitrospirota bacterium]
MESISELFKSFALCQFKPRGKVILYYAIVLYALMFIPFNLFTSSTAVAESYSFVSSWGSTGTGNSQFEYPMGVAVDSSGNV